MGACLVLQDLKTVGTLPGSQGLEPMGACLMLDSILSKSGGCGHLTVVEAPPCKFWSLWKPARVLESLWCCRKVE